MNTENAIDPRLDFQDLLNKLSRPFYESCLYVLNEDDFWRWPASLSFHHAYEGGLAAHTVEVARIALNHANAFPEVNRDVLITAALWHDVMKVKEYVLVNSEENTKGGTASGAKLRRPRWTRDPAFADRIGHISAGAICFGTTTSGMKLEDAENVFHCLLSHHGPVREWGSPVAPQTIEALILHQADMLSAKFGKTK